jgi:hypothetical protein
MSENQKVEAEEVELNYNQRAKNLVMDVPDDDFSFIYKEAVTNYTDVLDEQSLAKLDCLTLMENCAEIHAQFFAEYILQKILGEDDAEAILEGFSNSAFNFEHLQDILNQLDAGATVDELLENAEDDEEDDDDE